MKNLLILLTTLTLSSCCKTDCASTYTLEGVVTCAMDGLPSAGFEVELEEIVMENGVLNGFFQTAATTTTDELGYFHMEFPRKSALEYRMNVELEGWFPLVIDIDPSDFSPNIPLNLDLQTTPISYLEIVVKNAPPSFDNDKMRVRLLKSFTEFSNCHTDWVVMNGTNIDTTWNCILPGEIWMPYLSIDQSLDDDISTTDSVFCTSFETVTINITY
jgi:hypothetical protein